MGNSDFKGDDPGTALQLTQDEISDLEQELQQARDVAAGHAPSRTRPPSNGNLDDLEVSLQDVQPAQRPRRVSRTIPLGALPQQPPGAPQVGVSDELAGKLAEPEELATVPEMSAGASQLFASSPALSSERPPEDPPAGQALRDTWPSAEESEQQPAPPAVVAAIQQPQPVPLSKLESDLGRDPIERLVSAEIVLDFEEPVEVEPEDIEPTSGAPVENPPQAIPPVEMDLDAPVDPEDMPTAIMPAFPAFPSAPPAEMDDDDTLELSQEAVKQAVEAVAPGAMGAAELPFAEPAPPAAAEDAVASPLEPELPDAGTTQDDLAAAEEAAPSPEEPAVAEEPEDAGELPEPAQEDDVADWASQTVVEQLEPEGDAEPEATEADTPDGDEPEQETPEPVAAEPEVADPEATAEATDEPEQAADTSAASLDPALAATARLTPVEEQQPDEAAPKVDPEDEGTQVLSDDDLEEWPEEEEPPAGVAVTEVVVPAAATDAETTAPDEPEERAAASPDEAVAEPPGEDPPDDQEQQLDSVDLEELPEATAEPPSLTAEATYNEEVLSVEDLEVLHPDDASPQLQTGEPGAAAPPPPAFGPAASSVPEVRPLAQILGQSSASLVDLDGGPPEPFDPTKTLPGFGDVLAPAAPDLSLITGRQNTEQADSESPAAAPPPPPRVYSPFEELADEPEDAVTLRLSDIAEQEADVLTSAPQAEEPPPPPAQPATAKAPAREQEVAKAPPPTTETAPRRIPWYSEIFNEDWLRTTPPPPPDQVRREVQFIEDCLRPTADSQVLEVGCGAGQHSIELARLGFKVTGYDMSLQLLIQAAELAQREGLQVDFLQGDFKEVNLEDRFDAAFCTFTRFGYFNDDNNRKMIESINRALKVGGRFLLGVMNRDYLIRELPTRVWRDGKGCLVLEEVEFEYFTSRVVSKRTVVFEDGRHKEQEVTVRAYSLHEVGKLLHKAGFRVLEVTGHIAHKGVFMGNQSRDLILLAVKKKTT